MIHKIHKSHIFYTGVVIAILGLVFSALGTAGGAQGRNRAKVAQDGGIFAEARQKFSEEVREKLPEAEAELGLGYLVGEKSGLSKGFQEALRDVGMTHIVVASGAHLAIITGIIRKIFGKISKFAGTFMGILTILAFATVVGWTASMTRAAIVAILTILTGYVGRKFTPGRLILLTMMITLMMNADYALNLGWQLSFGAFAGILLVAPKLTELLYGQKKPPWLASMLITSLATMLTTAPISIYYFGKISLLSFVANLVILPTLPYAMLGVFLTGVGGLMGLGPLTEIIAWATGVILNVHIRIIENLATIGPLILEVPAHNPWIFLLYLPICVIICPWLSKLRQKCSNTAENWPESCLSRGNSPP